MMWRMLPSGSRILSVILHRSPGLDLYCTDLAQDLITEAQDLDYPDDDIFVDDLYTLSLCT